MADLLILPMLAVAMKQVPRTDGSIERICSDTEIIRTSGNGRTSDPWTLLNRNDKLQLIAFDVNNRGAFADHDSHWQMMNCIAFIARIMALG